MPILPTFADFAKAFLARFVKTSQSAAARRDIPTLKHTDSLEAVAAHFKNVNSRVNVGSPIDTTTLANYFVNDLKGKLAKVCRHSRRHAKRLPGCNNGAKPTLLTKMQAWTR